MYKYTFYLLAIIWTVVFSSQLIHLSNSFVLCVCVQTLVFHIIHPYIKLVPTIRAAHVAALVAIISRYGLNDVR